MRYSILSCTLAYIGVIGSMSHASAQNNSNDVPVSIWSIIHTLSERFPPNEELPFLARGLNCVRCETYGVRTADNAIVDIAVIYKSNEIDTVIISNFKYNKRKCITMLDVRTKNNLTQKDYSFFPIPDSYTVQIGYKTRKDNKEIVFAADTSMKDKRPLDALCLSLFSVSKGLGGK